MLQADQHSSLQWSSAMRLPAALVWMFLLCGLIPTAQTQQPSSQTPAQGRLTQGADEPKDAGNQSADAIYEKWADEDVRWIMEPGERGAFFKQRDAVEKDEFIERFWARRDPTPYTLENEFKEEHYRRVAYANEHFGAGTTPGWESDRGRVYIVLGPPDEIQSYSTATQVVPGSRSGSSGFPYQVWRYRHLQSGRALDAESHEMLFRFVDYCKCGDYRNTSGTRVLFPRPLGEQPAPPGLTVIVKPGNPPQVKFKDLEEIAAHKIRLNLVPFQVRTDLLRLTDFTVLVPITVQVRNPDITFVNGEGAERATLQIFGRVTRSSGRVLDTFEDTLVIDYPAGTGIPPESESSYQKVLALQPGDYWLDPVIKDVNGDKISGRQERLVVAGYQDRELAASSLILVRRGVGEKNERASIRPLWPLLPSAPGQPPTLQRDQGIEFWMQVYNLGIAENTQRPSATLTYDVVSEATGRAVIHSQESTQELSVSGTQMTARNALQAATLAPGTYRVRIEVKDGVSKQMLERSSRFSVE
jgi:GWxTD domain-containing protein